ncbi:MAG TPA: HlyC/CorC family transporter [Proteobacteria bacterium]|nr:HlyC/CorC family transporter [Pseudomonadota bacterium]
MTLLALLPEIGIFLGLLLSSAIFSGTETALFSLRQHRLNQYRNEHPQAVHRLERILEKPLDFISTILVCNNFVNVAASALATRVCIALWGEGGIIIATIMVTVILLIGAEITPKSYAASRPIKISLLVAHPLYWLIRLLTPINRLLALAVNLLLRLSGRSPSHRRPELDDEEIRSIILSGQQQGLLRESEISIISNVLDIDKTRVRGVMKPRAQMISLALSASLAEIHEVVKRHGYSRYPVYDRNPEEIVGILHIKDLFGKEQKPFSLRPLLRPAHFVPETATLDDLLEEFRRRRIGLSIVVDEYGGVEGLISRNDIVSEIVGHLADETDASRPSTIRTTKSGSYLIPGTLSLRKIEQALPEISFADNLKPNHLAGLILEELGEIPSPGTSLRLGNLNLTVRQTTGNRIVTVELSPLEPSPGN